MFFSQQPVRQKLLCFIFLLAITLPVVAQQWPVPIGERMLLNNGLKMPSINASNIATGEKLDLKNLTARDLKFADKPVLVIFWARGWCPPCIKKIDSLVANDMDKAFNIISINVDNYYKPGEKIISKSISTDSLRNYMAERKGWNRIQHYQINYYDWAKNFETESTPFWLVMNADLKIVHSFLGYGESLASIANTLQVVEEKQYTDGAGTFYYKGINDFMPIARDKAGVAITISKNGDKFNLKHFLTRENKVLTEVSYQYKNGVFIYDGGMKNNYPDGKQKRNFQFVNGNITKGNSWYPNGDLQQDIAIPLSGAGYTKFWSEDGTLSEINLYQDGKLEGSSKTFDDLGRLSGQVEYKNGKMEGVAKVMMQGTLYKEVTYRDDMEISTVTLEQNIPIIKRQLLTDMNAVFKKTFTKNSLPEVNERGFIVPGKEFLKDSEGNEFPATITELNWSDIKRVNDYYIDTRIEGSCLTFAIDADNSSKRLYRQKDYARTGRESLLVIDAKDTARDQLLKYIKLYRSLN
jgi:antitoxin component YwqK of YwqJK toxin-antitoxin module